MVLNVSKPAHLPPRILIYGPQKIGKSTFGAMADRPVFIPIEDGLDAIDVNSFPQASSFNDVMNNLKSLAEEKHDFKTAVIDSLDWMEPLVWEHLIAEQPFGDKGKKIASIEDYGYGKGFGAALTYWREYIDILDYLRSEKDMAIIQIAHTQIRKFENPETDIYDRYELKLNKGAAALMMEHSDIILFAKHDIGIRKEEKAMSKEGRKRAVGTGDRVLHTEERPAFMAGNRYSLPAEIPFDKEGVYWTTIAEHVPYFKQQMEVINNG